MTLWTYCRRFAIDGEPYPVEIAAGLSRVGSRLVDHGRVLAWPRRAAGGAAAAVE